MSVREYVGARYVPIVVGEWDKTHTYEPLMVVTYQGASYTSRQYVPAGIEITNEIYWVLSANYNAQFEAYRKEVRDILPYDEAPTEDSTKGVTSDGIKKAIDTAEQISAKAIADETTRATKAEQTNANAINMSNINMSNLEKAGFNQGGFLPLWCMGRTILSDNSIYANGYTSAQAGLYLNGYYYVAVINSSTDEATILRIAMDGGQIINQIPVQSAGHCNGCCVSGTNIVWLYSFGKLGSTGDAYKVTILDTTTMLVTQQTITGLPESATQCFAIGYENDYYYILETNNRYIYKLDSNFAYVDTITLQLPPNYSLQTNRNGGTVWNNTFYEVFNNENTLVGFSLNTGEITNTYNINQWQGSNNIAEIESVNFDTDGNIYLVSQLIGSSTYHGIYYWISNVNKMGYPNQFGNIATSYTSHQTYYVNCTTTEFNPNGTPNHPFKYLQEAIIAASSPYMNKEVFINVSNQASSQTKYEHLNFINCNVHVKANLNIFASLHLENSNLYLENCILNDYAPIRTNYDYATIYLKNSSLSYENITLDLNTAPDNYAVMHIDPLSVATCISRAKSGTDIAASSYNYVIYGTLHDTTYPEVTQRFAAIKHPTSINFSTNNSVGSDISFDSNASFVIAGIAYAGHTKNKQSFILPTNARVTENMVYITKGSLSSPSDVIAISITMDPTAGILHINSATFLNGDDASQTVANSLNVQATSIY